MDKYGTVEDHIEPLDDGIYYMVEDADEIINDLRECLVKSLAQTDECIELLKSQL